MIFKLLGIATALAASIAPFDQAHPEVAIQYWANFYNVSYVEMYATINCETGGTFDPKLQSFVPSRHGPHGREDSWGIAQIHLPAHPDVTKSEAQDPDWAIAWMAREWSEGKQSEWTCFRNLDLKNVTAPSVNRETTDGVFDTTQSKNTFT